MCNTSHVHISNSSYQLSIATTVGGYVIVRIKIIARGTSGDDFIHLKTSYIKSKVIL
jgi:hypothetical protein